ncbi:MAG: UPF0042 nucleotide-binding protein [Francisellaceae bacterium]|jgi:UPF0042 nucleotide-binding protein
MGEAVKEMKDFELKLILISGRSGAGKTTVMQVCEDLGFFCIDNLPLSVLTHTVEILKRDQFYDKIMIGIDSRSFIKNIDVYADTIKDLYQLNDDTEIWYMDADTETLKSRYSETRRRHPYSHGEVSLDIALTSEKKCLEDFIGLTDKIINTSQTNIAQLRELVKRSVSTASVSTLQVNIFSFGFKYGVPNQADYIFDVRCLPNPYWEPELRSLSGKDQNVIDFFKSKINVQEMVDDIYIFIYKRFGQFKDLDRSYLDIGIGCTGGQHRSVYIVGELIKKIKEASDLSLVSHHRESSKW